MDRTSTVLSPRMKVNSKLMQFPKKYSKLSYALLLVLSVGLLLAFLHAHRPVPMTAKEATFRMLEDLEAEFKASGGVPNGASSGMFWGFFIG